MKKAIAMSLAVFAIFSIGFLFLENSTGKMLNADDFNFHFFRANEKCYDGYKQRVCDSYAIIPKLISKFFAFTKETFILGYLLILCFVIPYLIFKKDLLALAIYFSSSFMTSILFSGVWAQLLLTIIFILMLKTNDFKFLIALFFVGLGTHSQAFFVLLPVIIFKFADNLFIFKNYLKDFKSFGIIIAPSGVLNLDGLLRLLPLPFFFQFLALKPLQLGLIFYFFIAGVLIDNRAALFIPILAALWLPELYANQNRNIKNLVYLACGIYFFCNVLIFFLAEFLFNSSI